MTQSREQLEADLTILRDTAAVVSDEVEQSRAEREINRQWGAIQRLGDARAYEAEALIRSYLNHHDPTLRGTALLVLAGEWSRADVIDLCTRVAVDEDEDELVRTAAIETMVKNGTSRRPQVQQILEWLAQADLHPAIVVLAARTALGWALDS